jgi:hypothetical protein
VALLGIAIAPVGCGGGGSANDKPGTLPASPQLDGLDAARSFDDYTLYYLGDSFQGLPLTYAGRGGGNGTGLRRSWSFIYGTCTPPPGNEGGCAPPVEVQDWSICTRFPAIYPGPTPKLAPADGAKSLPAGGGLDVYTGETTIVIFGGGKPSFVHSLRRVSDDVIPADLPPPSPGSLEGQLPCQAHR